MATTSFNGKSFGLLDTELFKIWLSQFAQADREIATRIVSHLTLVSHSAFERGLTLVIEREAKDIDGPVALYATREVDPKSNLFEIVGAKSSTAVDATPRGSDLGSEARVAALIRNLARARPRKYLNHPSIAEMRTAKCRAIFVVDDFIGSGKRTKEFLASLWAHRTIRSWYSRRWIRFSAITYTGTDEGCSAVESVRCKPHIVHYRSCPTFWEMPWTWAIRDRVISVCESYGDKTSRRKMRLGFRDTMAALVFEHGCPNNAPAILWAPQIKSDGWTPLFPDRSVLSEQASAFPQEIRKPESAAILKDAGESQLAISAALTSGGPLGTDVLTILGLASAGIRSGSALSYATGLSKAECTRMLDLCVSRGFLTSSLRLKAAGRAELKYARKLLPTVERVPPKGEDEYYPKQLRGPTGG